MTIGSLYKHSQEPRGLYDIMYHRIKSIADEERLLEQVLHLQSQIREQREQQRKRKVNDSEKYTKIFEPVTKSIEKLTPSIDLESSQPLLDVKVPTQDLLDIKEELDIQEPGELYRQALSQVPHKYRDDGMLGLNVDNHHIGDYIYEVNGDVLQVKKDKDYRQFDITDLNLWKLLIVSNPSKINLKTKDGGKYLPFVYDYVNIAQQLNLLKSYTGSKNRSKYNILTNHQGSGFLFSVQPPTVVIPSDKMGLLSELYRALAELRAGNTMMRNLVVPLAQEAERRNILPKDLLSPEEDTWVFA